MMGRFKQLKGGGMDKTYLIRVGSIIMAGVGKCGCWLWSGIKSALTMVVVSMVGVIVVAVTGTVMWLLDLVWKVAVFIVSLWLVATLIRVCLLIWGLRHG